MTVARAPMVRAQMLIRRPVTEVFEAFVDPAITTRFWFSKSSGRVEVGEELRWEWEVYGASAQVAVKAVEANRRILIEWGDPPRPVEWVFTERGDGTTLVVITTSGFRGDAEQVVAQALDAMGGFTNLLAGLKAQLEHDVALNLVPDHHPDAQVAAAARR